MSPSVVEQLCTGEIWCLGKAPFTSFVELGGGVDDALV